MSDKMQVLVTCQLSCVFFDIVSKYKNLKIDIRLDLSKIGLTKVIDEYDILITRSETSVDKLLIDKAVNLKVIIRAAVGTDNIELDYAAHKGILVINCPNDNIVSTAEHALALIFAAARNLIRANTALRAGLWEREAFTGIELAGKKLGIIGLGKVGSRLAVLAKSIGMSVVAYDPYILPVQFEKCGAVRIEILNQLLQQADIISIHTPKTTETYNMLDMQKLKLTKRGVIVINCARGGLINEQALLDLLNSGHIYAAGLDVWENEPARGIALQQHSRVVSTPHIGASTYEAQAKIARTAAEQLCKVLNNEPVDYAVNDPQRYPVAMSWG